jgi:hypothetical protein
LAGYRIFGLITEPGENTTVFTMFGTKAKPGQPIDWIIVKVRSLYVGLNTLSHLPRKLYVLISQFTSYFFLLLPL